MRFSAVALMWGSSYFWIKMALGGLTPTQFSVARVTVGAAAMLVLIAVTGSALPRRPAVWLRLLVIALLTTALPVLLVALVPDATGKDVGVVSVFNASVPLWVLALSLLRRDRPGGGRLIVGVLTGFAGVLLMFSPWQDPGSWVGGASLVNFAAAIAYAYALIFMRRVMAAEALSPLVISASQALLAVAWTALTLPWQGWGPAPQWSLGVLVAVGVLGVGNTAVVFTLFVRLVRDEGPMAASTVLYLVPVVLVLGRAALEGTSVTTLQALGMVVAVGGVITARWPRRTSRRPVPRRWALTSPRPRTGIALVLIVACQAMILVDDMIVNIALPGMSAELALTPTQLSWVINSYLLTFGGLLLLGGRAGDILGHRRVFLAGVTLFTVTSLLRGLATDEWQLIAARAGQGVGAALASPCILALIINMYREGPHRKRAIAGYTAVGGLGAAVGLLVAGMLTSASSWHWVLMLNVPLGVLILVLAPFVVPETVRHPGRFDLAGALTSAAGLAALGYALSSASGDGWRALPVRCSFVIGLLLLLGFVAIERRARQPIVVPGLFADRSRSCAYLVVLLVQGSQIGQLFFLTQFFQLRLNFSPLLAALAFLPVTVTLLALAAAVVRLEPRFGARPLIVIGAAMLGGSNLLLARLSMSTNYLTDVLPALLLLGGGIALGTIPATIAATSGVRRAEAGSASSVVNALTTLGAALGLAVLVTVMTNASTAAAVQVPAGVGEQAAQGYAFVAGMSASFRAASLFAVAALVVALFIRRRSEAPRPAPASASAQRRLAGGDADVPVEPVASER